MDEHIYKIIELTGSSSDSIEAAIQNAIGKASQSLHNLRWFQVMETRGHIESGRVAARSSLPPPRSPPARSRPTAAFAAPS